MSVLDPDSPLLSVKTLSGIHEDAVRCIYDERLNRLKRLADKPTEQLTEFIKVADDAFAFWTATSKLSEDREGRRQSLSEKLDRFFDRVVKYADYHSTAVLSDDEAAIKEEVIAKAKTNKAALIL